MPSLRAILASQEPHLWPSTSGTVTAVVVVLTVVIAALCAAGLYFLHKRSLQYAKSTSRGRLQHTMSCAYVYCCQCIPACSLTEITSSSIVLYVVLMFCSILEVSTQCKTLTACHKARVEYLFQAAITAWLLAQYVHQDRFPSVGTRDGLRIAL